MTMTQSAIAPVADPFGNRIELLEPLAGAGKTNETHA